MSEKEAEGTAALKAEVVKPVKRAVKRKPKARPMTVPPVADTGPKRDVRPAEADIMMITASKVVDKFNTVRMRIEFTPAVCKTCGFDVCGRNNLGDYYEMNAETQKRVRDTLQAHKEKAHSQSSQHIIHKSELPTKWLGKSREEKDAAAKKILKG